MIHSTVQFISATKEIDATVITHDVRAVMRDSKLKDGLVTIILPKPEAGVLLLEKIPSLLEKVKEQLRLVSTNSGEVKNAAQQPIDVDARLQPLWLPRSISIPFASGELCIDAREEVWVVDCSTTALRREIRFQVLGDSPAPAQQRR